jgi:D-arabinose 1-dehydrogenase-like Zn-dependent alcohol dehydrogenase
MAAMQTMQVRVPGRLELNRAPIPEPARDEVRVRVRACGVCHSDMFTVMNAWPGLTLPRAPGHEIAGIVDAVGEGVTAWAPGARVAIGWHGGHDGTCSSCLRGDFITCVNLRVPGISYDGGYGEYVIAPSSVLAAIPDALSYEEAAPLVCAGITTFNALRHSGARPGDLVAVVGIGGLGHLGVQFAKKMGFETVAIARGRDKEALARELGAHHYIDSKSEDVAAKLNALGGARVVLSTVTSVDGMMPAVGGLGAGGRLVIVGVSQEPLPVSTAMLIGPRRSIAGWPSGTAADSSDTMKFSVLTGVRAMIETMPLERANEAYQRMMSGDARFRIVLTLA